MINKDNQYFYIAIVGQNLHINYLSSKDHNSDYQKKYLMPDTLDNNLNLIVLTKFISEKVKNFEKDDTEKKDSNNFEYAETIEEVETLSLLDKEIELIKKALERSKGKRKLAADELGISERTLYRKIKQYDLQNQNE